MEIATQNTTETQLGTFAQECKKFAATYKGSNFFKSMAKLIAKHTGVTYVLVGFPLDGNFNRIRTAVLFAGGKFVEKYEYDLYGTPCENVIGRNCCYYPTNIKQMFPEDKELEHLNIDSYLGLPVFDTTNKAVGLVAIMDSKIITNPTSVEKGLNELTPRIAEELKKITA